ncbi:MAG TPA: ribosomal protein S18-alanine N-acetyltransferase [Pyrinomonadaceae bacterium]|jgi:ribosomal-protein-alanine N-acetyltransferase|nr:ribosomal protein S18-alanine N-acetyltransferase [Pyrinomonadaceae bacterium]
MAATETAATSGQINVSIERMTEHDLVEVCAIEEVSELSAWGWDAYHYEMQSGIDTIMLVARHDSNSHGHQIAGFIVARLFANELHVNNVAVRPEFRGRGLGSALLQTTLNEARRRRATIAHLEVRAGNAEAQRLYQRSGFAVVGRRKNYYRDPTEDAWLMTLIFSDAAHKP